MPEYVMFHDTVNPATGKTIKQENLEKQHKIPVGTLVDVTWQSWRGGGACWRVQGRLWVVAHARDCDGTPLYTISWWSTPEVGTQYNTCRNFPEEVLTPVVITPDIESGDVMPGWWVEED